MANLIVAMVTLAAIITTTISLMNSALTPHFKLSDAWKQMRTRSEQMVRTEMSTARVSVDSAGTSIEVTVRNDGETPLRAFDKWDLFVSYAPAPSGSGLKVLRLDYTEQETPGTDEWSVPGIYLNAAASEAEIWSPGIVDSGEEFVLRAKVGTPIATSTASVLTLAAQNGVTLSTQLTN